MTNQQAQIVESNSAKKPSQPLHKQPRRRDLVFHLGKTLQLVKAVLWDNRISILRKGAFVGGLAILLVLLLFPELLADSATLLTPLFSLVGIEIPVEGSLDWMAFALGSFSLLSLFPKEVLGEHYERIFHR